MSDQLRFVGEIGSVEEVTAGDVLAIDALAGSTVLYVHDVADFEDGDTGGWLSIDDEVCEYSRSDDDNSTLTLIAPLTATHLADTPVGVRIPTADGGYAIAVEYEVEVTDENGAPQTATLRHGLIALLPEGSRGLVGEQAVVVREDGDDELEIVEILGRQPVVNATFVDPTTLPPEPIPVEPPDASPTVTTYGMPRGIIVQAAPVAATTTIEYHLSATSGFTPDASTLLDATRSLVINVEALPDGTPLAPESVYYLRTVATNAAGPAPASAEVEAGMRLIDSDAVETLIASKIVTGDLVGAYALLGALLVGAISVDADDGIVVPGVISIPANGTDIISMVAHAVLRSATVEGNASLYGLTQLFGTLRVANGITNPSTAPTISASWPSLATNPSAFDNLRGMTDNPASTTWITVYSWGGLLFRSINKTTGGYLNYLASGSNLSGFDPKGGVVRIGSSYYVLGQDFNRSGGWYVYIFDASYAKTGEWFFSSSSFVSKKPAIGAASGNVVVATSIADGRLIARTVSTAGATVSTYCILGAGSSTREIGGVHVTSADFGAAYVVTATVDGTVMVSDPATYVDSSTPLTRWISAEWKSAESTSIAGLSWNGTRWRHLDTGGTIWDYSLKATTQAVDVAHTWYDGDSGGTGTHETAAGQRAAWSWKARTWLQVTTPPPPDAGNTDPTATDKANRSKVYLAATAGTLRVHATLAVGATTTSRLDQLETATAAAPTTNGFTSANSAAGALTSTAVDGSGKPLWSLRGDGDVVVPWRPLVADVTASATSLAAGSAVGVAVSYSSLGLTAAPVAVNAQVTGFVAGAANIVIRMVSGISATGCTLTLLNTSGAAVTFSNLPIRLTITR